MGTGEGGEERGNRRSREELNQGLRKKKRDEGDEKKNRCREKVEEKKMK